MYLYILSRELALTCFSVTVLLWLVALRYGAFTRKAQRAYQDGLAETNEVLIRCSIVSHWCCLHQSGFATYVLNKLCTCHLKYRAAYETFRPVQVGNAPTSLPTYRHL